MWKKDLKQCSVKRLFGHGDPSQTSKPAWREMWHIHKNQIRLILTSIYSSFLRWCMTWGLGISLNVQPPIIIRGPFATIALNVWQVSFLEFLFCLINFLLMRKNLDVHCKIWNFRKCKEKRSLLTFWYMYFYECFVYLCMPMFLWSTQTCCFLHSSYCFPIPSTFNALRP